MSINLLESVQSQMGYPALQKIDPNTQVLTENNREANNHLFGHAAIPAILTALYKYSRTDEGAENLLNGITFPNWATEIFGEKKESVIQKIAQYTNYTEENAEVKMNEIAGYAFNLIKENIPTQATVHDVKKFLSAQRNHILPFLPAVLQMGNMLNDNTLDDRTNKMEGPISSLMHKIGDRFSDGEIIKEEPANS